MDVSTLVEVEVDKRIIRIPIAWCGKCEVAGRDDMERCWCCGAPTTRAEMPVSLLPTGVGMTVQELLDAP